MKSGLNSSEALAAIKQSHAPAYYRLYARIKLMIESGQLAPGQRLPSLAELAREEDVSYTTAVRGLSELEREGLVECRWGSGNYVAAFSLPTMQVIIHHSLPSVKSPLRNYYDHVIESLRAVLGSDRRISFSYLDGHGPSGKEVVNIVRAVRADSLLVFHPTGQMLDALRFAAREFPVASVLYSVPDSGVDAVISRPGQALRRMLEKRLGDGRKVFAFVGAERLMQDGGEDSPYEAMHRSFLTVMNKAGLAPHMRMVATDESGSLTPAALSAAFADLPPGATVVSCTFHVPSEAGALDLIGYTEYDQTAKKFGGRFSVLYLDVRKAVGEAARLLLDRVAQSKDEPARIVALEPEIRDRWMQVGHSWPRL